MRNLEKLNKVKALIKEFENNNEYQIDLTTPSEDNYRITIRRVVDKCFLCKCKYHISRLSLRQDKRVKNLITPKLFCLTCKNKVDKALDIIKPTIPKDLQVYTK